MTKGGIKERNWARECGRAGAGVVCVEREVRSRRRRWKGREILGMSAVITRNSRSRGRPLSGSLVEFYASAFGPLGSSKRMASERLVQGCVRDDRVGRKPQLGLHGLIRSPPQQTGRHLFRAETAVGPSIYPAYSLKVSTCTERLRTTMH
jgi:hypothetical protein